MRYTVLLRIFALKPNKCYVLHTAGHCKPSWNKHSFFEFFRVIDQGKKADFFSRIFFWLLQTVHIPDGIIRVRDLKLVPGDIKRKFLLPLIERPVRALIDDLRPAVLRLDIAAVFSLVSAVIAAVENHHIRRKQLFHNHRAHIGEIHIECRRIHGRKHLYDRPSLRQRGLHQRIHPPGTVILQKNLIRMILFPE